MNAQEQKDLTDEIVRYAADYVKVQIDKGKIPESWDGVELRMFLCDRISWHSMDKKRLRDYKNTCMVRGL